MVKNKQSLKEKKMKLCLYKVRRGWFLAAFCSKFVLEYISIGIPLQLLIAGQME